MRIQLSRANIGRALEDALPSLDCTFADAGIRAANRRLRQRTVRTLAVLQLLKLLIQSAELRDCAHACAAAYRTQALRPCPLVTGRSAASVRDFADAFRVRRRRDG